MVDQRTYPQPEARTASIRQLAAHVVSLARVPMAAVMAVAVVGRHANGAWLALALLVAAGLSDYADGALARSAPTRSPSGFGRWIDAFTDMLVFLGIYTGLMVIGLMPSWLYVVFLARETVMYAVLRPMAIRLGVDHGARRAGKLKTVLQFAGCGVLLLLLALQGQSPWLQQHLTTVALGVLLVLVASSAASLSAYWRPLVARWPAVTRRLPNQIAAILVGLTLAQIAIYAFFTGALSGDGWQALQGTWWDAALIAVTLFHVAVATFLFARHADWVNVETGAAVGSLNPPNVLTLTRLSSIPTLTILLILRVGSAAVPWLLAFVALIFVTDLIDGRLARRMGQITRIGSYLDSSSDYLALLALVGVLAARGVMPAWLAWVLAGRLLLQGVAMLVLVARHGMQVAQATWWGKISVAAAMVLVTLELVSYAIGLTGGNGTPLLVAVRDPAAELAEPLRIVLRVAEWTTAGIIGISVVDKIRYWKAVSADAATPGDASGDGVQR